MIQDKYGRTINYMRISVTDRCNLRCGYCMPCGIKCLPMEDLLTFEEIAEIAAQAAQLGIDRFRITGGEPLMRKGCSSLVSMIRKTAGVREITLTTNGVLLGENLEELLAAGLDGVNISLDTPDRRTYEAITGRDELDKVLASVHQAAGRLKVKINCVVQSGINEDAPVELAALAKELPVDVRFIEMMPIGSGKMRRCIPNREVKTALEGTYGKAEDDGSVHGNGPARYYRFPGFCGSVGFISAVHERFCSSCNRIRLTCSGELKPCLCYGDVIPLKPLLRDGMPYRGKRIREKIIEAVSAKPLMHCFEEQEKITEERKMAQIGG